MRNLKRQGTVVGVVVLAVFGVAWLQAPEQKDPIRSCAQELSDKVVKVLEGGEAKLGKVLRVKEVEVLDVEGKRVYLGIGEGEGISVGIELNVVDSEGKEVGRIKVVEVRKKLSIAEIVHEEPERKIEVGNKAYLGKPIVIGVVDFLCEDERLSQLGVALAETLSEELRNRGVKVVEREFLNNGIKQLKVEVSKLEKNRLLLRKLAEHLGADVFIFGILSSRGAGSIATIKLTMAETGQVIAMISGEILQVKKDLGFKVAIWIQPATIRIYFEQIKNLLKSSEIPILHESPKWLGWQPKSSKNTVFVSTACEFVITSQEPLSKLSQLDFLRTELVEAAQLVSTVQHIPVGAVEGALWWREKVYTDPPYIYKSLQWHSNVHGKVEPRRFGMPGMLTPPEGPHCPGDFTCTIRVPNLKVVEARLTASLVEKGWLGGEIKWSGSISFDNITLAEQGRPQEVVKRVDITDAFTIGEHLITHRAPPSFGFRGPLDLPPHHDTCWFILEALTDSNPLPFTLIVDKLIMRAKVSLPIGELFLDIQQKPTEPKR